MWDTLLPVWLLMTFFLATYVVHSPSYHVGNSRHDAYYLWFHVVNLPITIFYWKHLVKLLNQIIKSTMSIVTTSRSARLGFEPAVISVSYYKNGEWWYSTLDTCLFGYIGMRWLMKTSLIILLSINCLPYSTI